MIGEGGPQKRLPRPGRLALVLPGSVALEGASPQRACPEPAWATPTPNRAPEAGCVPGARHGAWGDTQMLNDPRIITQALDQTPTVPITPQKELENSCPADQVETACGPGARG